MIIFIKIDLALNNQQRLICHKTQTTNQPIKELTEQIPLTLLQFKEHVFDKIWNVEFIISSGRIGCVNYSAANFDEIFLGGIIFRKKILL